MFEVLLTLVSSQEHQLHHPPPPSDFLLYVFLLPARLARADRTQLRQFVSTDSALIVLSFMWRIRGTLIFNLKGCRYNERISYGTDNALCGLYLFGSFHILL